jgi:hypothetical protein
MCFYPLIHEGQCCGRSTVDPLVSEPFAPSAVTFVLIDGWQRNEYLEVPNLEGSNVSKREHTTVEDRQLI